MKIQINVNYKQYITIQRLVIAKHPSNMSIFALKEVEEVLNGKISFYKLVMDEICLYDEFCEEIENNKVNLSSLNKIRTYMNLMAKDNSRLPVNKFNSIKKDNKVVGYEFKDNLLRVYIFKKDPNIFIIMGGYKKNQKKDISKFLRIIKECNDLV